MSRQVVQLHTIEQWNSVNPQVQQFLLRAIKLRDRLWSWRLAHEQQKMTAPDEGWYPCRRCDRTGWLYAKARKAGIHPSAMYSTCLLKIYYEAIGVEAEVAHEARQLLIFDIGTACHDMLQGFGLKGVWGPYYRAEVPIEESPLAQELMIVGHADADNILVIDEIPDAPIFEVGIVHEYKSINDNGYDSLKGKPKPQHVQQATVYSACLNRPVVVYLYVNKNNSNIQDFPIPFQPQVWAVMQQKAAIIRDAVKNKTPPQGDVGYHCKDCGYVYQCPVYKAALAKKGG